MRLPAEPTVAPPTPTSPVARRLFWIVIGLGLLVAVLMLERETAAVGGPSFGERLQVLSRVLFGRGYDLALVAALAQIPFFVLAFVLQNEAGAALRRPSLERGGRAIGAGLAGALIFAVDVHDTYSASARGSTGAIGDFVFPFVAVLLIGLGYYLGAVVGWVMQRTTR